MTLTPEQRQAVAAWAAAGEGLSAIQRRLAADFKVTITYMDLRFLLEDLSIQLKDAAPKADTNLQAQPSRGAPEPAAPGKKGFLDKAKEKLGLGREDPGQADGGPGGEDFAEEEGAEFAAPGGVSVAVDKVTLLPGALASGTMTFSNGVSGKWIVDNQGRPGITELSRQDFRPSPADAQAFMQELSRVLQQRGF